jgi:murein L,D-transpeptidase YafK
MALVAAAFLFMGAPALFALAGADVPETSRSRAAVDRTEARLVQQLQAKGMSLDAAMFVQITKTPAQLTVFKQSSGGAYSAFRSWPICAFSGGLGPKKKQGDGKSPEGFYSVAPGAMNPASSYHLSFNLGYPNAHDRARGYTGDYLMVHGNCVSIGCYAMTDDGIDEIWTLMRGAFEGGQARVPVHIFPFEMTAANLQRHAGRPESEFWRTLAPAWAEFEATGQVPRITGASGTYRVETE